MPVETAERKSMVKVPVALGAGAGDRCDEQAQDGDDAGAGAAAPERGDARAQPCASDRRQPGAEEASATDTSSVRLHGARVAEAPRA